MSFRALVSGYGPLIHVVEFSGSPASIRVIGDGSAAGTHPSYLAHSSTLRLDPRIYAVDELNPAGAVAAYSADARTGALTQLGATVSSAGADPCHVCVHPGGHALYVSNYSDGGLSVHAINREDGMLGSVLQVLKPGPKPHQVVLNSAGTRAFVPVLGMDAVFEYAVAFDGTLQDAASPVMLPSGSGPRHIALSEARGFAVTINELACTISLFKYDAAAASGTVPGRGSLTLVETVSSLPPGISVAPGYSTAHITLSPDGRFVYGSNRGHNSIGVWSIEHSTQGGEGKREEEPRLRAIQWHGGGSLAWDALGSALPPHTCSASPGAALLSKPRDFSLSPDADARFLLCANQLGNSVTLFARDRESGTLVTLAEAALPVGTNPCCVLFPQWLS